MKYTGPIFRPPPEAKTFLLQVTMGCTHNTCSFCTMYKGTRFAIESMEQIEQDLREAKQTYQSLSRIFLLNGDPFGMPTSRLKAIAQKIIDVFPEMETITMYASIHNIRHKTDADLRELCAMRVNDLWIGVESGNDEVLHQLNKGYTSAIALEQLTRLHAAGIRHNGMYILGAAGSGNTIVNAIDTARLINATNPQLVGVTTLGIFSGSTLAKSAADNSFIPATEREILEEERKLIELLEVEELEFFGDHPINAVTVSGVIPEDKQAMLETIDYVLGQANPAMLDSSITRSTL